VSTENVRAARVGAQGRMSEDDARRRMAAQVSDAERVAVADLVIDNAGSVDDLSERVGEVWRELRSRNEAR